MRRTPLLAALLLAACGSLELFPPVDPPDDEPDRRFDARERIGDPEIERAACEPAADAPGFRRIAAAAYDDAMVGSCGELTWNDPSTKALHFAGVDEEPRAVAAAGRALWLDGHLLLHTHAGEVVLEETGEAPRTWTVQGALRGGAIPGTGAFWACSATGGIARLDGGGATALTPDFLDAAGGYGCLVAAASRSGAIAYATRDHRIGVVHAATGTRVSSGPAFHPHGTVDEEGLDREDLVFLAPDASFVLHEKRWYGAVSDDAFDELSEGVVTAASLGRGFTERLDAVLVDPWTDRGRVWEGTAPAVLLAADAGAAHLIDGGGVRRLDSFRPLSSRGNHVFGRSERGAALLDLAAGRVHELFEAPSVERAVPFRWGGPVAFSHFTGACIRYPDRPDTCHAQLWAVTLWDEVRGARRVALGTQPLHVYAVGPEGQLVVGGELLDGPPPPVAEPADVPWRVAVLGPDGRLVRALDAGARIDAGLGGAHFALVERRWNRETSWTAELVRIDWATGEERVLVEGRGIEGWALDDSDRRASVLVLPFGDARHPQLWTGALEPRAAAPPTL